MQPIDATVQVCTLLMDATDATRLYIASLDVTRGCQQPHTHDNFQVVSEAYIDACVEGSTALLNRLRGILQRFARGLRLTHSRPLSLFLILPPSLPPSLPRFVVALPCLMPCKRS